MAHRLVRAAAGVAAMTVLALPTSALGDESDEHASPSAEPHADHGDHTDHAPAPTEDLRDHGATPEHQHGTTTDRDAGDDGHDQLPATVTPEVRNLVLSGFAGVNAAVVLGAWMMRRTGRDPDPRKRASKATS